MYVRPQSVCCSVLQCVSACNSVLQCGQRGERRPIAHCNREKKDSNTHSRLPHWEASKGWVSQGAGPQSDLKINEIELN